MNKPAHPVAATPIAYPDYHQDAYGWAMAQAAILRSGRLDSIDWENVAEEIESVGRSERSEYTNHMIRVLQHMIKWEVQPERRGISWWLSIMNGRGDAENVLEQNPSLKPVLDEMHEQAMKYARRKVANETGLKAEVVNAVSISRQNAISLPIDRPEGE